MPNRLISLAAALLTSTLFVAGCGNGSAPASAPPASAPPAETKAPPPPPPPPVPVRQPSTEVAEALAHFTGQDDSLIEELKSAAGYAVFPSVKKGGLGVGAARGSGEVIEKGEAVGKATMTQGTIGFQAGGQEYAELIIFETPKVLADFKDGKFAFDAQVSAVAVRAGGAKNLKYQGGVKVISDPKGGLMYEATVGGQKFSFEAYK